MTVPTAPKVRHTTFRFTLEPSAAQREALSRHVGAARFAFNTCLELVTHALAAKKEDESTKVPWSSFDLINAFNRWKVSKAAGTDEEGHAGLPWRGEVCQQVFEEAAVDLARGLAAFSAGRKGERRGKPPRFPRYKKKSQARPSFRIRNKGKAERAAIRVGSSSTRAIRFPSLGSLRVRECTRKLRRMIRKERAKVLFATVSLGGDGRWRVTLNVEAAAFHPSQRHPTGAPSRPVGIDRGLKTFAVMADATGREVKRVESPRPLREARALLRRRSKDVSRKKQGSRNRERARKKLAKTHARIAFVRRDFAHRLSSDLVKTHDHVVIEDLCTIGLMRTRLARAVADSAFALFATMLTYKAAWRGAIVTVADRFYPSTRRCSACGFVGARLKLSNRTFRCSRCGHEADRDTNAAMNLASYPKVAPSGWSHVAAKHAETQNVRGEESAGVPPLATARETPLDEAERASAQRPRRAVSTDKTVNTL